MNDLKKLISLRKINIPAMAREIGHGYHSVQKTIKGVRRPRHIQEAIAGHIGLTWEHAFGPGRSACLKRLILAEISKAGQAKVRSLHAQYLADQPLDIAI